MTSIDNRVVQMTFDNASFERKMDETIRSLEKLNQTLAKTDSQKGLSDLNKSVKKFDASTISNGITGVSKSFLAMGTIAATVLSDITKRAVQTGINLAKSLSLDLVIGGFQEYETNMRSIQTILSNTKADGTNLQQVNAALDELNSYADLTIYNFAEMARNIGTFTAAGVDLETSTQSIKGIANLAAISGSSSQQASVAMYQLSQAISSGTVKLMDWNSVVNAGMGGEVFQRALFETGKTLGTIANVPIDQTFDEWTDAGNTFRDSLQDGWITSDVLTTTLQGFTGEMTNAELAAIGFTEAQIANIQEMGQTGVEAATKVRTLTQLFDTAKEAVGSGWSLTFRTVIGDFEQATELFTTVSDALTGVIEGAADRRNTLLADWEQWGGRDFAIDSFILVFEEAARVVRTVRDALQTVFPPKTAQDLFLITTAFKGFAESIGPVITRNLNNIRRTVIGFANGFVIVKTVLSEAAGFIISFFSRFVSGDAQSAFDRITSFADRITELKEELVDGGGIETFFSDLEDKIDPAITKAQEFIDKLKDMWTEAQKVYDTITTLGSQLSDVFSSGSGAVGAAADAISERFGFLSDLSFDLDSFLSVIEDLGSRASEFASSVLDTIAQAFEDANYDGFDAINTGIFGVIAAAAVSFVRNGPGGLFGQISESLEGLTDTLEAMQLKLKAEALESIARAVALLAASVFVLSLVDSRALSKALAAMTVGFGQLVGAMTVLNKLDLGASAVRMAIISAAMVTLAAAILILSLAVKVFSTMNTGELIRGLTGITVAMGVLIAGLQAMPEGGALLRSAAAMLVIAGAMNLMATAAKIFATMSWEEFGRGMAGIAGSLGAMVIAMNLMPKDMAARSAGMLAIAAAMVVMASAAKIFASMSWEEFGRGMAGLAGALALIVIAMRAMPPDLALKAAGLLALAGAVRILAGAVEAMAALSWEGLLRGLAGLAGVLLILGVAMAAMSGTVVGAAGLLLAAVGINILAGALERIGNMSIAQIVTSLLAVAGALVVIGGLGALLGVFSPLLLGFGVAMLAVGVGVAALGIGLKAIASAMKTFIQLGPALTETLSANIRVVLELLPEIVEAVIESFSVLLEKLTEMLPTIFEFITNFLLGLFETAKELIPQFVEVIAVGLLALVDKIVEIAPTIFQAGADFIIGFVTALTQNIGPIVAAGLNFLVEFLNGVKNGIPNLVGTVVELIASFILAVGQNIGQIVAAGAQLVIDFIVGIGQQAVNIVRAGFQVLIDFMTGLADAIRENDEALIAAGMDILSAIFEGVLEGAKQVTEWFTGLLGFIVEWIGDATQTLVQKGTDVISGLWNGIDERIQAVITWFGELPGKIIDWIGSLFTTLGTSGKNLIAGLYNGMISWINEKFIPYLAGLPGKIVSWIVGSAGNLAGLLVTEGRNIVIGMWNGIVQKGQWLADKLWGWVKSVIPWVVRKALGIESPSRVMMEIGGYVTEGLWVGMEAGEGRLIEASRSLAMAVEDNVNPDVEPLKATIAEVAESLSSMEDDLTIKPTITPVIDMTQFERDAKRVNGALGSNTVTAKAIAKDQNTPVDISGAISGGPSDVSFTQNIYAPTELSADEIYRQTKNQIAVSKEELGIS